ncbi:peptidoglycan-associated lipoprotein [Oceanospirillum multiglobuliferum]|uniref:Peptidoglycan-associated lipoprotein n=1 Tax=Oceanospirillum multiglobuliferum TaxID=64969 RepID=A0A1T4RQG0_9GAMM|nr:peptidoglycan-associated lipoprotein Pal [Oceanospirillum multiglobuliferum]OPX54681.1 peptidoglycan-associated lipoprotein [Oceanospirillum multiglobuliferum]SKA18127.1 peptidoglycan-associated lipoprotein [Oceanospirillum multiglobuliferum]
MELKKYSKSLFFGATLAVLAGCGGNAATQEQTEGTTAANDNQQVAVAPTVTSDGATGSGTDSDSAVSGQQLGADTQAAMQDDMNQKMAAMPDVGTIYFDFDQSSIRADSREVLDLHVAYLRANPMAKVTLEGHADERGTREYNMALGLRRGNAVKSYFQVQGVSASQIEVTSYGEERPAVIGHNQSAWSKNRRVEINY